MFPLVWSELRAKRRQKEGHPGWVAETFGLDTVSTTRGIGWVDDEYAIIG